MAWSIVMPFAGKKGPKTPSQWVRFPWEKDEPRTVIAVTDTQVKALDDIFNDFIARKR